jgi:glutamine synthetase
MAELQLTPEEQKTLEIYERFDAIAYGGGDLDELDELVAEDFSHHAPFPTPQGRDGYRQFLGQFRQAFPDHTSTTEDTVVENGTPISELVQSYNAFGRRDKDGRLGAAGEVKLQPDPETMRSLPYAEQTGCMLCNIETLAGNPWPIDPRSSLQKFISEMAYQPAVAFESEFHLFTRDSDGEAQPLDTKGVYLTESTRETHETIRRIVTALESQGLVVEKYYPEYAAGKHEVVIGHQPGLRAADEHILLRETVKSVARTDNFRATFLPRPFGTATNGCHIHLSLWDDANRFFVSAM